MKMKIIFVHGFLFLFFLMSLKVQAYSFTDDFLEGFYWQSFPVPMNIFIQDKSSGELLERLVFESESEWEEQINFDAWDIGHGVERSDSFYGNYITWSNNFAADTGYDPSTTLGVTIREKEGTFLERVIIILNGELPYLRANQDNLLKKTILHEMGHTIGLGHTDQFAIMQAFIGDVEELQLDDIDGGVAVINETLHRQQVGYVSQYAYEDDSSDDYASKFVSCGTVMNNMNGSGPNTGAGFIISLLLGTILLKLLCSIHSLCRFKLSLCLHKARPICSA